MLWNGSAINGFRLMAGEVDVGAVHDLMFDDVQWKIRWLVVETGHWLGQRKVLAPASALDRPDPEHRHVHIRLAAAAIKDSPTFDHDAPMDREMEGRSFTHYGLTPYWEGDYTPLRQPPPPLAAAAAGLAPAPDGPQHTITLDRAQSTGEFAHLISMAGLNGFYLEASDGDIGHVTDVLFDPETRDIRFLKVHTGEWWAGQDVLISPHSIQWVDMVRQNVEIDATRQKVKDAPRYRETDTVDGAYEESFLTYYGIRWMKR